jgi:stage V sporulation protein B
MNERAEAGVEPKEVRAAGRGGLAVLVAKVFFILTGLVQQALLPKAIGLADYGALSRVLAVSNVFNNVLISSSTQGVSRTTAAAGEAKDEALRATLRVHGVLAVVAMLMLAGAAPLVAHFQHAPDVLAPLLVMTGVLGVYGVYAPLVGYINGRAMFTRQASLDIVAATLRTFGLLGVGWLFVRGAGPLARSLGTSPGVLGATAGAVLAACGVFLLALRWTGTGKPFDARPAGVPDARAYAGLIVPVMVAQLFTNALMQTDIILLGRYVSLAAAGADDPQKAANEWVAVYRACQLFAFLPYQMLFSVTQVLFPMLAKAKKDEGDARVAELVSRGCRIGAIVCGMLVCVVLAMPGSLIKFAYGAEVAARGVSTLRMLALGQAAFAMLGLATTILVSLGREKDAMVINGIALAALAGFCVLSVMNQPFGEPQLVGSARGVTAGLGIALLVGGWRARSVSGGFVPWKTRLRVGACVAAAYFAGGFMPTFGKLITPVIAAGVGVAYVVALVVTREIGKEDLSLVLAVAARRAKR